MNIINKKVLFFALCYTMFIGIFFINKNNIEKKEIDLTSNSLYSISITGTLPAKNIALTFDDGPYGTSTEKILDILKQENIHATFFLIGKNVEEFPSTSKRISNEGHLIGNHSYDHSKNLRTMSTTTFQENIQKAESTILFYTGLKPKFFRPPYGLISAQMYGRLNQEGFKTVLWNIDGMDWDYENTPTATLEKTIIKDAVPNGIILMHDGRDIKINYPRDNTINALAYIIETLKKEGYTFVTVDKIINTKPYFDEK